MTKKQIQILNKCAKILEYCCEGGMTKYCLTPTDLKISVKCFEDLVNHGKASTCCSAPAEFFRKQGITVMPPRGTEVNYTLTI